MKRFGIFILFALFSSLLLAACNTPISNVGDVTGKQAMKVIYDVAYDTAYWAWFWVGCLTLPGCIAVGIFVYKVGTGDIWKFLSGLGSGIGSLVIVLIIAGMFASSTALIVATKAVDVGADRAKTRKANQYVEKLHIPVTKTVIEKRGCGERNNSSTGCRYEWTFDWNFHEDCTTTTDSKGNSTTTCTPDNDTMHVPFFTEEWRAVTYFSVPDEYLLNKVGEDAGTGLVKSSVANMPLRYMTDWQAPEVFNNLWYGRSRNAGWENRNAPTLSSFEYVIPAEWKAMDASLRAFRPFVVTVYHDYVNWVFVTAESNNFVATSSRVKQYESAGLLPVINMLYSRFGTANKNLHQDYDFVQFRGLKPANVQAWQDAASLFALKLGPELQGSLILWFVPAKAVDNPDALIQAGKAHLSDPAKWQFNIAPKNLVLIMCGVSEDQKEIEFCRMETGMPSGNINIRSTIDRIKNVPFTPSAVFGSSKFEVKPDANGFYKTSINFPSEVDGFMQLIFAKDGQGFVRVKMQSLDWLKTDIKLDKEDIIWAIEDQTADARSKALILKVIVFIVSCFMLYGAISMSEGYGGGGYRRSAPNSYSFGTRRIRR